MKKIALVIISILFLSGLAYGKETPKEGINKEYYESGQLKYELIPNDAKNGKAGGISRSYSENGRLEQEIIFKDSVSSVLKVFYESGNMKSEQEVNSDGYPDGFYTEYYEDGAKKLEMTIKDGKRIGILKEYYNSGKLKRTTGERKQIEYPGYTIQMIDREEPQIKGDYKYYNENGILIEEYIYFKENKNLKRYFYDTGERKHEWITWWWRNPIKTKVYHYFKNGKLKKETNYLGSDIVGIFKEYYEKGQIKFIDEYEADELVKRRYFDPDGNEIIFNTPTSLDECLEALRKELTDEQLDIIKLEDDEILRNFTYIMWGHSIGMDADFPIRTEERITNGWLLWAGSSFSKYFNSIEIYHPKNMASIIIIALKKQLNGQEFNLQEEINLLKGISNKNKNELNFDKTNFKICLKCKFLHENCNNPKDEKAQHICNVQHRLCFNAKEIKSNTIIPFEKVPLFSINDIEFIYAEVNSAHLNLLRDRMMKEAIGSGHIEADGNSFQKKFDLSKYSESVRFKITLSNLGKEKLKDIRERNLKSDLGIILNGELIGEVKEGKFFNEYLNERGFYVTVQVSGERARNIAWKINKLINKPDGHN